MADHTAIERGAGAEDARFLHPSALPALTCFELSVSQPSLNLEVYPKSRRDFLKHLEYFVCGPDLPAEAIEKFKYQASGDHLSGSDIIDLTPYCRSCVRQNRLEPHRAADEFFKLAVECGAMPGFAENLPKSIRVVKLR